MPVIPVEIYNINPQKSVIFGSTSPLPYGMDNKQEYEFDSLLPNQELVDIFSAMRSDKYRQKDLQAELEKIIDLQAPFLKTTPVMDAKSYFEMPEEKRNILRKIIAKQTPALNVEKFGYLNISKDAQLLTKAAKCMTDAFNREYPNGYVLFGLGNTPSSLLAIMSRFGAETKSIHFSKKDLNITTNSQGEVEKIRTSSDEEIDWNKYFAKCGFKKAFLHNPNKKVIFIDSVVSGDSLKIFYSALKEMGISPGSFEFKPLFQTLIDLPEDVKARHNLSNQEIKNPDDGLIKVLRVQNYPSCRKRSYDVKGKPAMEDVVAKNYSQPLLTKLLFFSYYDGKHKQRKNGASLYASRMPLNVVKFKNIHFGGSFRENSTNFANLTSESPTILLPFENSSDMENALNICSILTKEGKETLIKDKNSKILAEINQKRESKEEVFVMGGKSGVTIFVKTTDGLGYRMAQDSSFETRDLKIVNHPKIKPPLAFRGNFYISLGTQDEHKSTVDAANNFKTNGNVNYFSDSKVKLKYDYNVFLPAGGEGSRANAQKVSLQNETLGRLIVSKPALSLPIPSFLNKNRNVSLIEMVMGSVSRTGVMNNAGVHLIYNDTMKGSAFELVEAIAKGTIPTDKPLFITHADRISDLNYGEFFKVYEKYEDLLGLMATCSITEEKVKTSSIIKGAPFQNGVYISEGISEPSDSTRNVEDFKQPDGTWLRNIPVFLLSPAALKSIKALSPEMLLKPRIEISDVLDTLHKLSIGDAVALSKDYSEQMLNLAQKEISGKKIYAYAPEGQISDVGNLSSYIDVCNKIKNGGFNLPEKILKEFGNNVDSATGCVYLPGSRELSDKYLNENSGKIRGKILVEKLS